MADAAEKDFSQFYQTRRALLLRFLAARLKNHEEAEEVMQEAFVQFRQVQDKDPIASPDALLIKIAANLSIDRMRQNNSRRAREKAWSEIYFLNGAGDCAAAAGPIQHRIAEARGEIEQVLALLERLSYPVRTAFILHRFKGLSHREVAARLGLSTSTVEKHIIKAMKLLIKEMA
ncbi:MAG: RNA polymerase sigma factor [Pseudomonadota bacterium]